MEIHVIRHTLINFDKNKCYGQLEVPLKESFEEEAEQLAAQLSNDYQVVFSSTLSRCFKLADHLKLGTVKTDTRLLELDFGDWEGKLWNDINQDDLNHWMEDFVNVPPTNGETLNQMFERVSSFIDEVRKQNFEQTLIVTHAGVIRCFWAYFLQIPLKNIFKLPVGFNEVLKLNLGETSVFDAIKQTK